MFILVLHLLTYWKWVDQTEKISMGLEFMPFMLFEDYPLRIDIVFIDLDLDGDEDMLLHDPSATPSLSAFENVNTATGRMWQYNSDLINGIPLDISVSSVGKGDLNNDNRDEIVITSYYPDPSYALVNTGEVGSPYWENDLTLMDTLRVWEPDFADIDGDGDQDMVVTYGYITENDYFIGPLLYWNCGSPQHPEWVKDTTYFWSDEWEGPIEGEQPSWMDWDNDGVWDLLVIWEYKIMDVPPPEFGSVYLFLNEGTADPPVWNPRNIYDDYSLGCVTLLDWNQDGIEDFLIQGNEYDGGYRYYPGERDAEDVYQEFGLSPCYTWGGIMGQFPAATDVTDDEIPELTISEHEHHMALDFWGGYMWGYLYPHFRYYSSVNQEGTLWREDKHEGYGGVYLTDEVGYDAKAQFQYVNFNNDALTDYVITSVIKPDWESDYVGTHNLYRNQGTRTAPDWVLDTAALKDLPPLFPTCFLDIDHDRDQDVIGVPAGDSTLVGYINTRSDNAPNYMQYDLLISGLEGLRPVFMSAADINGDGYTDLAVGLEDDVVAYFNTKLSNPRWERHDEVFAGIEGTGNPCLCDGDGDGDLDLFIVQGGRLHYYRNESTGVVDGRSPAELSGVTVTYIGDELEISLAPGTLSDEANLLLYNTVGQRVMQDSRLPQEGTARFRISQPPGVYFYRVSTAGQGFTGKVILY